MQIVNGTPSLEDTEENRNNTYCNNNNLDGLQCIWGDTLHYRFEESIAP